MSHSDEVLETELRQQWAAQLAPPGFSAALAELAQQEEMQKRRFRRAPLVPIVVAAFFVSLGAAAAWGPWSILPAGGPIDAGSDQVPGAAASSLSFHEASGSLVAEPERELEAPPLVPQAPVKKDEKRAPEAESPPQPEPRKLHLPRCECGTSAVVCTCIE